jgi:hypothetical protein
MRDRGLLRGTVAANCRLSLAFGSAIPCLAGVLARRGCVDRSRFRTAGKPTG